MTPTEEQIKALVPTDEQMNALVGQVTEFIRLQKDNPISDGWCVNWAQVRCFGAGFLRTVDGHGNWDELLFVEIVKASPDNGPMMLELETFVGYALGLGEIRVDVRCEW